MILWNYLLSWVPGAFGTLGVGACGGCVWGGGEGSVPGRPAAPGWVPQRTTPGGGAGERRVQRGFRLRVQGYARRCRGAARGIALPGGPGPRPRRSLLGGGERSPRPGRGPPAPAAPRGGLWAGGCGGLRRGLPRPSRAERVGGERGSREPGAAALRVVVAARRRLPWRPGMWERRWQQRRRRRCGPGGNCWLTGRPGET